MLYEEALAGRLDLEERIPYLREDYETGTGVIVGYRFGTAFTLRKLAELAIVESDNAAANMLLRRLGKQPFLDFRRAAGAQVVYEGQNLASPTHRRKPPPR